MGLSITIDPSALVATALEVVAGQIATPLDRDTFVLHAGPFLSKELRVVAWEGREAISDLFEFDIVVVSKLPLTVVKTSLLGQSACFSLTVSGQPTRELQGIINRVEALGSNPADEHHRYQVRLVPRLWLLSQRRNSRVFQNKSVLEMLTTIFEEHAVTLKWGVSRKLPVREYCVQYEETDYEFLQRMCADEGLFFYFEHVSGAVDELLGGLGGEIAAVAAGAASAVAALGGPLGAAAASVDDALAAAGLIEKVVILDTAKYPNIAGGGIASSLGSAVTITIGGFDAPLTSLSTPTVRYNANASMAWTEESIHQFRLIRTFEEKSTYLRSWSFRNPLVPATGQASTAVARQASIPPGSGPVSMRGMALTSPGMLALDPPALGHNPKMVEVFDHYGAYSPDTSGDGARRMLEGLRRERIVGVGEGDCRRLTAGHAFSLVEHADLEVNMPYAVVSVTHRGRAPEFYRDATDAVTKTYENEFRCIPASVPYRPVPFGRIRKQFVEFATVVGPKTVTKDATGQVTSETYTEDVWTDSLGRIKVAFAWDRYGNRDETSSCWVHVAQPWAGAGWGFQFIPRVGMTVIVLFEQGDADRPIVVGCAPTPVCPPPFTLPLDKNKSGIRSQSTLGGGGENEIYFDDTKGSEMLVLHAERDARREVERNDYVVVGGAAGGSQFVEVAEDQEVAIRRNQNVHIFGNRNDLVDGDRYCTVLGAAVTHVAGSQTETVTHNRGVVVGGDDDTRVDGSSRRTVLGDGRDSYTGGFSLSAGERMAISGLAVAVSGTSGVTLTSSERVRLVCQENWLELTPDGITINGTAIAINGATQSLTVPDASIRLESAAITLASKGTLLARADDSAAVESKDAKLVAESAGGGKVTVSGSETKLVGSSSEALLNAKVTIQGSEVHLNPGGSPAKGSGESATPDELKTSWVDVSLVNEDGEPEGGIEFEVEMSNGDTVYGVVDARGMARVPIVPGAAKIRFPTLDAGAWKKG